MRIIIDQKVCNGCGVCVSFSPDIFIFDKKGKAILRSPTIPEILQQECCQVSNICPVEAIEIMP